MQPLWQAVALVANVLAACGLGMPSPPGAPHPMLWVAGMQDQAALPPTHPTHPTPTPQVLVSAEDLEARGELALPPAIQRELQEEAIVMSRMRVGGVGGWRVVRVVASGGCWEERKLPVQHGCMGFELDGSHSAPTPCPNSTPTSCPSLACARCPPVS